MDREEIHSKATEWATQTGLEVRSIEDPTADFHISVSEPNLPPVDIVHPKIDSAYVLIASRVLVSEEDQKKMMDMKFKQLDEFLWDIRMKLLSMNVEFRIVRPAGVTVLYFNRFYARTFSRVCQGFLLSFARAK